MSHIQRGTVTQRIQQMRNHVLQKK
jgi:hypothetical protein